MRGQRIDAWCSNAVRPELLVAGHVPGEGVAQPHSEWMNFRSTRIPNGEATLYRVAVVEAGTPGAQIDT